MNENRKEQSPNSSSFINIMQELSLQITSILSIEFYNMDLDSCKFKLPSNIDLTHYLNEIRQSISFTKMKIINQITSLIDKYTHNPLPKDNDLIIFTSLINELTSMSKLFKVKKNQYEITNDLLDFHLNALNDQINTTSSMNKCFQLKEELNGVMISLEESYNNYNEHTKESLTLLKNNYMSMVNDNCSSNNSNTNTVPNQKQQSNMTVSNSSNSFKTYSNGKGVVKTKGKISGIPMSISMSTSKNCNAIPHGHKQGNKNSNTNKHRLRNSHKSLKIEIAANTENLSKSIEIMKKKNALTISKLARNQSPINTQHSHSLSISQSKTIEANTTTLNSICNNSNNTINTTSSNTNTNTNISNTTGGNSITYYKSKIQEQVIEINKLKQSLIKEQSQKIALKSDLMKLKAKLSETIPTMPSFGNSSSGFETHNPSLKAYSKHLSNGIIIPNGYSTNNSNSNNNSQMTCSHTSTIKILKAKLDKFTEMLLRFSNSMSSLHDAVFKKNSNLFESKAFYEQLKFKLQGMTNDLIETKSTLQKLTDDSSPHNKSNSQSNEINSNEDDQQIPHVIHLIHENHKLKEKNNSLREYNQQLTEKIITFRNMDGQQYQFQSPTSSPTPPSETCDYNDMKKRIDELQKENIMMKQNMILTGNYHSDLPEDDDEDPIDNGDSYNDHKEKEREKELQDLKEKEEVMMSQLQSCEDELLILKGEVIKFNAIIEEKNKEMTRLKGDIDSSNNSSGLLNRLKETHANNILQLKQLYEKMLNDKSQAYNCLSEKCKEYEQEIVLLKQSHALIENSLRDQNINHEVEMTSNESDKIKLEMQIEELKSRITSPTPTPTPIQIQVQSIPQVDSSSISIKEQEQLLSKISSLQSHIDSLNKTIETNTSHIMQQDQLHQSHLKIQEELNAQLTKSQSDLIAKDNLITEIKGSMKELRQKYIGDINEKDNEIDTITQNHQNDLNELNIAIIKLKCQITKLQEENMTLTYSQRSQRSMQSLLYDISKFNISFQCTTIPNTFSARENDLLRKEINDLKHQITSLSNHSEHTPSPFSNLNSNDEHDLSFDGSSRLNFTTPNIFSMLNSNNDKEYEDSHRRQLKKEINEKQQKEELHVLKTKLRTTLEENKKMSKKLMELEDAANKIKEDYINVLRVAFEKFVAEIQLSVNAKQYANIVFKMMNYTEDDINDIYTAMSKKKGGSYFGFLRK